MTEVFPQLQPKQVTGFVMVLEKLIDHLMRAYDSLSKKPSRFFEFQLITLIFLHKVHRIDLIYIQIIQKLL